ADNIFGVVVRCELGAGLSPANCRAEVDQQLKSRFARFGKWSRFDDRANTYVNGEKLLEGDERRWWSFERIGFMHCASLLWYYKPSGFVEKLSWGRMPVAAAVSAAPHFAGG